MCFKEDLDISLDPYRIQSESFPGICSSLAEMLSARGEKGLPTLHTTLDSGISSDACKGLTKQGTNHLQEVETASPFCSLSVWAFIRCRFGCLAGFFSAGRGGRHSYFPLQSHVCPKMPNLSVPVCFKDPKTSLEAQSVSQLLLFSLGTKVNMCHQPQKRWFCFSLLRYSE